MRRTSVDQRQPVTRRQWGSDRRDRPLPTVAPAVPDRRITLGRLAIVMTVSAWICYVAYTIEQQFIVGLATTARLAIEAVVYLIVVTGLAASAMAYLITRIGFFYRTRAHARAPRAALDAFYGSTAPGVTVLVPSYQEDERVIRTTLLSAALQEYPGLRVVLLVDDPQTPKTAAAKALLEAARALPARLEAELAVPAARFRDSMTRFEATQGGERTPSVQDMLDLAGHYRFAVNWLAGLGLRQEIIDHTDVFFVDHVLGALAADLESVADALSDGASQGAVLTADRCLQLYRRLIATFEARLTSFERKRYVSLSHEPNKAMNLNSYIGLMGGSYQEVATPLGVALVPATARQAELVVPDPDYVLTLDADSVLLPEYALRIVQLMEQSAYAKQGVAQTPYSSFPGSASRIERISGATTDIQHIVHQGMTQYDATFWVGANAVLRKKALNDIVEIDYEGDWEIRRYIQDRTVIEDTESTIDLGIHGWSLLNYPERLAYSATPPDFGSLCIQRQRWANGGLLILSKLRAQVRARRSRGESNRFGELFLRVNYMASIFWSSICLLVMLCYPFNDALLNPILLLVSVPYFLMMSADLKSCGYKRLDVLRVYGFNLILLPVNLSGSIASILQLLTGEKSSFKRTPKVRDRTTAATVYILSPLLLIALCAYTIVVDIQGHRWENLFYAVMNAALATYAMVAFVGVGNCIVDLFVHLRGWLFRPVARSTGGASTAPGTVVSTPSGAIGDWASVVHYGTPGSGANMVVVDSHGPAGLHGRGPDGGRTVAARRPAVPAQRSGAFEQFAFFTVFQPIVDLNSGEPVGYEALTRFADGRSPQGGLDAADEQGIGIDLDAALVRAAVASAKALPDHVWLSINVSGGLLRRTGELQLILADAPCPVVLEVGDAAGAESLQAQGAIPSGAMVAIDDSGAGYESLSRIEQLRPSYLKLSRTTIAGMTGDAARRAFVSSLVQFAEEHDCRVIAQGIETEAERDALRTAGVELGQGYFLGRPVPADHTKALPVGA